jgi:CRISPR-associated protein Cas1
MRRVTAVATPVAHLVGPGKLKVVNEQLAYTTRETGPLRLDPRSLRAVYCYGPVGVTDEALQVLFAHEVEVAWLTPAGTRCRGRLVRADPSRAGLRLLQHLVLGTVPHRLTWARQVVIGKVQSQLEAARHHQRHGIAAAAEVIRQLQDARAQCEAATVVDSLRGLEGTASAAWFGLLGQVLGEPWNFVKRTRRPPTDPVNALLSLGYTWLLSRTVASLDAAGLEVYLGGLHEYRAGRPSLACDVMEPLRVPAVDRWVVRCCREKVLSPTDFVTENGGVRLQPGIFGRTLQSWEEHWLNTSQEAALEEWVETLSSWIRREGSTLVPPNPSDGEDL